MQTKLGPIRNELLLSLPSNQLASLLPKLTRVPLEHRKQIYDADSPIRHVYFVDVGMISLVSTFTDGMQVEIGIIGPEGLLGASLASNVDVAFFDAVVQIPGSALRMSARDFQTEFADASPIREVVLRYGQALLAQTMQTAICNAHHGLEQRLARWLLMAHDRTDGDELPLTQEFLAAMLSVHRPSLTVASRALQRANLIRHASGHTTILDRTGLEAAACECYDVVRRRSNGLRRACTNAAD